jgi:enamine deaminase RidA (YjgF/YER057c/UK114 family)
MISFPWSGNNRLHLHDFCFDIMQHPGADHMSKRKSVASGSPFESIAGFCRAVQIGNTIAVAGTAPLDPNGKTVAPGDPAAQARRCFEISARALEELGAGLEDVIRTRVFLTRIQDWEAVAAVHGEFFREIRPVCTMLQVSTLIDPEWLVETEMDAIVTSRDH